MRSIAGLWVHSLQGSEEKDITGETRGRRVIGSAIGRENFAQKGDPLVAKEKGLPSSERAFDRHTFVAQRNRWPWRRRFFLGCSHRKNPNYPLGAIVNKLFSLFPETVRYQATEIKLNGGYESSSILARLAQRYNINQTGLVSFLASLILRGEIRSAEHTASPEEDACNNWTIRSNPAGIYR